MPANLPPQYYELEREFKKEKNPQEKLRLAQQLLAMMPKHKGTDKLQADMKTKISRLKKEIAGAQKKPGGGHGEHLDFVKKEGAGQVVLIGPPNTGKSSLLDAVTNAEPLVADYPYTTREPQTGMMAFETIRIQLVDTPPLSDEQFEGYQISLIRNADLVALVIGLDDVMFPQKAQYIVDRLAKRRVYLVPRAKEAGDDPGTVYLRTLIVAHKIFEDNAEAVLEKLRQIYPEFDIVGTSILDENSLEEFKKACFRGLDIIRVYTKTVGHDPDFQDPIILKPGATVEEAALHLHKDFSQRLQFAKVWGRGKFDGQRVQKNYELADGDIIEFHV
jgi:ribosome-interacting GTPase 1